MVYSVIRLFFIFIHGFFLFASGSQSTSSVCTGISFGTFTSSWQLARYRLNKFLNSLGVLNFSGLPKKTAPFASCSFWILDHFLFIRLFSLVVLFCFFAISRKIKYKKTITQTSLATQSIPHNARYLSVRSLFAYYIFVLLISILRPSSILRYMIWWIVYLFAVCLLFPVCYVSTLWGCW